MWCTVCCGRVFFFHLVQCWGHILWDRVWCLISDAEWTVLWWRSFRDSWYSNGSIVPPLRYGVTNDLGDEIWSHFSSTQSLTRICVDHQSISSLLGAFRRIYCVYIVSVSCVVFSVFRVVRDRFQRIAWVFRKFVAHNLFSLVRTPSLNRTVL